MRQDIVKVYGNVHPAGPEMLAALQEVLRPWGLEESVELEGDLLRLAHEGIIFPLDDLLDTVPLFLTTTSRGKIDFIDLEAWTLTRFLIEGKAIGKSARGLNDVLAYSGW